MNQEDKFHDAHLLSEPKKRANEPKNAAENEVCNLITGTEHSSGSEKRFVNTTDGSSRKRSAENLTDDSALVMEPSEKLETPFARYRRLIDVVLKKRHGLLDHIENQSLEVVGAMDPVPEVEIRREPDSKNKTTGMMQGTEPPPEPALKVAKPGSTPLDHSEQPTLEKDPEFDHETAAPCSKKARYEDQEMQKTMAEKLDKKTAENSTDTLSSATESSEKPETPFARYRRLINTVLKKRHDLTNQLENQPLEVMRPVKPGVEPAPEVEIRPEPNMKTEKETSIINSANVATRPSTRAAAARAAHKIAETLKSRPTNKRLKIPKKKGASKSSKHAAPALNLKKK